jgi:hypothetical protein
VPNRKEEEKENSFEKSLDGRLRVLNLKNFYSLLGSLLHLTVFSSFLES